MDDKPTVKKVIKGVGPFRREVAVCDFEEALEMMYLGSAEENESYWDEVVQRADADDVREAFAADLRHLLKEAGIEEPGTNFASFEQCKRWQERIEALPDHSDLRFAVLWLAELHEVKRVQTQLALQGVPAWMILEITKYAERLGDLKRQKQVRAVRIPGTETRASAQGKFLEELLEPLLSHHRPNQGMQEKTKLRQQFLCQVSSTIGSTRHKDIAAAATQTRATRVHQLWHCSGELAKQKILAFLRNHKLT